MVYAPISTTDLPTILCARPLLTIHTLHAPLTWVTFQVVRVSVKLLKPRADNGDQGGNLPANPRPGTQPGQKSS
jgi:hypothetical protein